MRNYGYSEKGPHSFGDLNLWRRIATYAWPFRGKFAVALLLSLLITAATLAQPHLLQLAIDHSITAGDIPMAKRLTLLSQDTALYGLVILIAFLCSFVQVLLLQWLGQTIMYNLRQNLFRHLLDLDLRFFNTHSTGQLVTRLTNDVNNMNEMFTSVAVTLFNDLLRLSGILILLCMMNLQLAGLMMLFIPAALLITGIFAHLLREAFRKIRSQLGKINGFLSETLAGISILQLFVHEELSRQRYAQLTGEYLHRTVAQIRLFGAFMPLTELLSSSAVAVILWYGGSEVLRRELTLGELAAFLSYMRLFFQPLRELAQKYSIVQSAMASAERIFEMLNQQTSCPAPTHPLHIKAPQGEVVFDRITFAYEEKEPVLKNVSLTLPAGKTVAVVGATGSGKSTLVKLLLRFYDPQEGSVRLDGIDLRQLDPSELRNIAGVIFQDIFILDATLLANIVLDRPTSRDEVEKILTETGMNRFVSRLPKGLDTRIGDGGLDLSTGEKQLLSFARVLCRKPLLLVLDEATAAIDTESENILEEVVAKSFSGRTSLIIAHRLATVRRADLIIVMAGGQVVEQGTHSELLAAGGQYARLIELDLRTGFEE
ncbi:ABC transporter ATP-binding protein [Desulforhopalus vacuolatus]|uniref:ABC transporter ATP-binding protein n=1 Tax=Desulforhopalus vacuolatus TaxID=40414 RepID=UPI001962CF34|nr:ABC transporter ATP-binding protein [Desulforhopalus vacuolatus]MBM9519299.1 ABC transporter ATP-binding protein [Desulforhopalus vacuolatus]